MGLDLREAGVKYLIGGGEPGFGIDATRRALADRWGENVIIGDTYGIGECMFAGIECGAHPGGVHVPEKCVHAFSFDPETGEIILKKYYHLGVAVSTNDGLIVPVVRHVDRKSILELAVELNNLVKRTRERKVSLEEMQGGTFTITNVGPMGGGYFAPIINYPEAAILGLGAARMVPVVKETEGRHEIIPRLMMPVVLCIDHRILDGVDALDFMRTLLKALEDPDELFMTMT